MGMDVSIRGWTTFDNKQLPTVLAIVDNARHRHHRHAWTIPPAGGLALTVFFGGGVRESAVAGVREQMEELAAIAPVDADNDYAVGHYALVDERGSVRAWEIEDGGLRDRDAPELRWLDKR